MITSYAQNFEDVMLWRATGHVTPGFYIDIGAQDPVIDSVSMAFYEKGWRGLHIEPAAAYADALRLQRPDEEVRNVAIGPNRGKLVFHEFPQTGLSTGSKDVARLHLAQGLRSRETTVDMVTLDDLLDSITANEIHWLKIDVEGMEAGVIAGWKRSPKRPWVIVVESIHPGTTASSHGEWEGQILDKGYQHVYFDGVNRFYLSNLHAECLQAFQTPPNIFDEFMISGTASNSFHHLFRQRQFQAEVRAARAEAQAYLTNHQLSHIMLQRQEEQKQLESLKQSMALAENKIHTLCLTLDETKHHLSEAQQALDGIYKSRSWRITAPLRAGLSKARTLFGARGSTTAGHGTGDKLRNRTGQNMLLQIARSSRARNIARSLAQRSKLMQGIYVRMAASLRSQTSGLTPLVSLTHANLPRRAARLARQLSREEISGSK